MRPGSENDDTLSPIADIVEDFEGEDTGPVRIEVARAMAGETGDPGSPTARGIAVELWDLAQKHGNGGNGKPPSAAADRWHRTPVFIKVILALLGISGLSLGAIVGLPKLAADTAERVEQHDARIEANEEGIRLIRVDVGGMKTEQTQHAKDITAAIGEQTTAIEGLKKEKVNELKADKAALERKVRRLELERDR